MGLVGIRYRLIKLKNYLAIKTEMVNHQAIIREVASGVERSWIYYLMLLMAGLIALLGLLTNSVAVVIGAMLISPLMGPIISSGLALTIGDLPLARRAFRIIAISVALTILVTAIVTFLSPLKEPTSEILSRVRPNIYDLFVAMLSGVVGAVALCTKRNYLITATGVAVATAVIPPLSVAGYGVGTGQFMLGLGGFLLFFTNFVAILLTSDLVFFIMGFRTSHVETIQYSRTKRLIVITVLLLLISIPLVHTLVIDIRKVNTGKRVERILKRHLNHDDSSRMTGYNIKTIKGRIEVRATVNTVAHISRSAEETLEDELSKSLRNPVKLHLEQLLVASEKLPVQPEESVITPQPREDTPLQISTKAANLASRAEHQLSTLLKPFPVKEFRLAFRPDGYPLEVHALLHRDWPASDDEVLLLGRQLSLLLEQPVVVLLKASPLFSKIVFTDKGSLSDATVADLAIVTQLPGGAGQYRFYIDFSADKMNRPEISSLKKHLIELLKVPENNIILKFKRTKGAKPVLNLRISRK